MKINAMNTFNYSANSVKQNKTKINFGNNAQKIAVYAGSFDPITNGHFDLIKEASKLFDKLIVLIAKNPKKVGFIPIEERLELIKQSVKPLKNVSVDSYEGLTVNYAKEHNAEYLLRGLRGVSDFDNEKSISSINEILDPKIKTIMFFSSSKNSAISSSAVREILANNGDVKKFVPKPVYDYLMAHYQK